MYSSKNKLHICKMNAITVQLPNGTFVLTASAIRSKVASGEFAAINFILQYCRYEVFFSLENLIEKKNKE